MAYLWLDEVFHLEVSNHVNGELLGALTERDNKIAQKKQNSCYILAKHLATYLNGKVHEVYPAFDFQSTVSMLSCPVFPHLGS